MATQRMDVFSHHSVPFDVAAFARMNPYRPEVIELRRKLLALFEAERIRDEAQELMYRRTSEAQALAKTLADAMKKEGQR